MFSDDEDDWGGDSEEDLDARYGVGTGADNFDESNDMFDTSDDVKINPTTRVNIQAPSSPTPTTYKNPSLSSYDVGSGSELSGRASIGGDIYHGRSSGMESNGNNKNTSTPENVGTKKEVEYRVISTTDVLHEQNELIVSVSDLLQVPRSAALALLLWSGWSKERLLEKYMGGDKAAKKVCKEAGITELIRVSRVNSDKTKNVTLSLDSLRCNICYEELSADEMSGLSCDHQFCRECWNGYLHNRVQEGSTSIFTYCPMEKCTEMCTEDMFQRFSGAAEFLVYRKYLAESYVDINSRIRWCSGKNCEKAIVAENGGVRDVKCVCGTEFCFRCSEEAHFPLTCKEREEWVERCDLESGAANWILENTKKCPQCSTRIEKNSGCNKISCNSAGCGHHFCWICLGPWAEHGNNNFYGCNKFVKQNSKKKTNKENRNGNGEDGSKENDRFLHYFKRYTVHSKAQEFSEKYLSKAKDRLRLLLKKHSKKGTSILNQYVDSGEFYINAARTVVSCRRLLKYSYAFAYGLSEKMEVDSINDNNGTRSSKKAMEVFTYMQSNLENNTESLSEMSEKPIECVDRETMLNFVACTNTLVDNLRKGIQSGLASSAYTRILRFSK
jgi:ariadne-1